MTDFFLSLLYPNEETYRRHTEGSDRPIVSKRSCEELGLTSLLPLKNSHVSDYLTKEPQVITFREEAFADLTSIPTLSALLSDVCPILRDVLELRRLDAENADDGGSTYLYSITEIELYVRCIRMLREGLEPLREQFSSLAFRRLTDAMIAFTENEDYRDLIKELDALTDRVHEIKSITVGVNLDAQYRPVEAGVISVNADAFKSGKLLDKILRLSFKNDAMTCIAPLTPFAKSESENRQEALTGAFRSAFEDIFKSSVKGWRQIVGEYVLENTDFLLRLLPEIEFLTKGTELLNRLSARKLPLCTPTICKAEDKAFEAYGIYNADVALRTEGTMVRNDLVLDDRARIYVLSGPNRGGKSVITCAMGQAQCLFQLGLSVPADRAVISPVDALFTHFPEGADDTIDKGRLGEECARLREIFDALKPESMILLDESLSSTGSYEASFIAGEILTGFAVRGCRGIFSTHLHELAAAVPDINERTKSHGGVQIDTLVAGMEEGERSFRIDRRTPDGKSYARDIARRYGLSFDTLITN